MPTDTTAYRYRTAVLCRACLIETGIAEHWLAPAARDMPMAEVLWQATEYLGISTSNPRRFPRPIPSGALPAQATCTDCGRGLS